MDEPQEFSGDITRAGLYYVETEKYFPLRGNGWYSQAMVNYCIVNHIISKDDIISQNNKFLYNKINFK